MSWPSLPEEEYELPVRFLPKILTHESNWCIGKAQEGAAGT